MSGNEPVTFRADQVSYDRDHGLVTATGHVEAWQNDHILRADRVTFDRNTNVAAAHGHVVIAEPDGEILFADYAELTQGMKDGVLTGMRALLASNGRLAGNGGRRIEGKLNELSRGAYTTCNVCALDPSKPPMWQIRAFKVTQDLVNKRIEYQDAYLDFFGFPVAYFPFFSNTDPSVNRQTGFLTPNFGFADNHLGSFVRIPYYIVLDGQSDVTLIPTIDTMTGPQLEATYRRDFNNGKVTFDGALAYDAASTQGYLFATGIFSYNDTWRYGFNINVASSTTYLRDFQVSGYDQTILSSSVYAEGFGIGAYSKVDVRTYQGLDSSINQSLLPYVLPRYQYSYFGEPDALGGRFRFDTEDFNVLRNEGTDDQRLAARVSWDRPFAGYLGDRWLFTAQASGAGYNANVLNGQPNYNTEDHTLTGIGQVQAAVKLNWPFIRDAGSLGTQILEPIVQVIAAPQSGNSLKDHVPNEDSLDYEFTDATLFDINRYGGYDRYDGGLRVNYALHGSWIFNGGEKLDGIIGQSWHEHTQQSFQAQFGPTAGLGTHLSDVVGRVSFDPDSWFDVTARARVTRDRADVSFFDGVVNFGHPILRFSGGLFYGADNPYSLYTFNYTLPRATTSSNPFATAFLTPREEATAGISTHFGHWSASVSGRRDLETNKMVSLAADGRYENECLIFDITFLRRYTSINFDQGDQTLLFTLTLKTVGAFGFSG